MNPEGAPPRNRGTLCATLVLMEDYERIYPWTVQEYMFLQYLAYKGLDAVDVLYYYYVGEEQHIVYLDSEGVEHDHIYSMP